MAAMRTRLALDQNFPTPILDRIAPFLHDIEFVPLTHIDARLSRLGDRELIIALHQLKWTGLVTNNYRMLQNPSELAAIIATKLSVFAVEGVGDDPIRATGAILLDLPAAITATPTPRHSWPTLKSHARSSAPRCSGRPRVSGAGLTETHAASRRRRSGLTHGRAERDGEHDGGGVGRGDRPTAVDPSC